MAENKHSRLANTLEQQLTESDSGQYEVGEQRERNHRYYTLEPLGNEQRGRSHYISPDVLDSVESKKAIFKETFLGDRTAVKFKPVPGMPGEAEAKTAYVDMVLQRNNKAQLFRDGWHDAFVAKRMVTMTTWKDATETIYIDIDGADRMQVMQLLAMYQQQEQIRGVDQTKLTSYVDATGERYAGPLGIIVDASYVDVHLCVPERYHRDPQATYPDDAMWNTYEESKSRAELIRDGFDEDQVMELSTDYRWRRNEEDWARKAHDRSAAKRQLHNRVDEQEHVTLYKTWTYLDLWDQDPEIAEEINASEDAVMYEIHWAAGQILRKQSGEICVYEVDEQPFNEWTEYKISHAEHGLADADITAHTQKVQSVLKRLIIDNQQMRNTSRWAAKKNGLLNARDLMDNVIGGIVWETEDNAVRALPAPELSPLTMSVIGMLSQDADKRSGMSDLAKGMNTDAVRYQNAEGLIDKLTTAGNRRVMGAVRDWAQTFLVPLAQKIVRIGMEYDKSVTRKEVAGKDIIIQPSRWTDSKNYMAVAKALTPEENTTMAQQLLLMHSVLSQDPELQTLYSVQQKHKLMDLVFESFGIEDTTDFMMRPDSPQFMQAMQQRQQQMQQQMQMQQQIQQFQTYLMQSADRREWQKLSLEASDKMRDDLRADEEFRHQTLIDWENIDIQRAKI